MSRSDKSARVAFPRSRAVRAMLLAGLVLVPLSAGAFDPGWTDFKKGEPLSASAMNQRFDALRVAVDQNETDIRALGLASQAGTSSGHLGDIKASILTEPQFQALHGTGWILMDGRSIVDTPLADLLAGNPTLCPASNNCSAPDARGVFMRMANHGRSAATGHPEGDHQLGAYESDNFLAHNHGGGDHLHGSGPGGGQRSGATGTDIIVEGTLPVGFKGQTDASGAIIDTEGGSETRPRNITVNYFIRVE